MKTIDDTKAAALLAFLREPSKGDVVEDRFTLRERIGEGGMGVVYAARDAQTGEEVAIKLLRSAEHPRFEREVQALSAIAHPAIVRYVASGVHRGTPYIVMDRLRGATLAERLTRGPLSIHESVALGMRIAEGLSAAHRADVVHRDVKPSNVFLDDGEADGAKLLDFGVARPLDAATLTKRGALVGTPGYMAPEQVRGEGPARANADIFALGCVLFECLAGKPAFADDDTHTALARILLEPAPELRALRPDVPRALERLVERMLDKDEARRPTADEVARELGALDPSAQNATQPFGSAHGEWDARPSFEAGAIIGAKYRIERRIGEGGMGFVVAARHLDLGKRVALKFLRTFDPSAATRFLREAQAASHIESEHVVRVLDVGRVDERTPYIVMEYLDGVDLAAHLAKSGPMRAEDAIGYVLQICDGVADAHRLGIVHRDLKPSNLFLTTRHGKAFIKVLDFGISKLTKPLGDGHAFESTTDSSGFVGSIAYMSPEQIKNSARVDARTDVWSLGVVLFELLSARTPFAAPNAAAVAARIAADAPTSLRTLGIDAPEALERLLSRCLEKSPEARPESVEELARALRRSLPQAAHDARDDETRTDEPQAPRRRSWRWAGLAGMSAIAGAVAFYAFYMHQTDATTDHSTTGRASLPVDVRQAAEAPPATRSAGEETRSERPATSAPETAGRRATAPDASITADESAGERASESRDAGMKATTARAARTGATKPVERSHPAIPSPAQASATPKESPVTTSPTTEPSSTSSRAAPELDLRDPALLAQ